MGAESLIDAVGRTPVVRLRVGADRGVEVFAKLELQNLFAMKDRVAKKILTEARRSGALGPGAPVVESSSGTMALGVALVGTLLGHPVHIVTDPRIDPVTLAKLTALGCEVHVVRAMDENGWQGARLTRLRELLDGLPGAFWPKQYENPENPAAYRTLADELTADLGEVHTIVGAVGSGGSLCGTSRVLRERTPGLRVIGVDCVGSVLFGQPDAPQRLQSGLGNSLHPSNLDHSMIDEVHWLNDHEAFAATRELARHEKIFAGNTAGSVYRILTHLAATLRPGARLVGIFPDRGDRYADTVYSDAYWIAKRLTEQPLAARPRRVGRGIEVRTWSYRRDGAQEPLPGYAFVESNTTGTGMLALRAAADAGYRPLLLTNDPSRYRGLDDTGADVHICDTADLDGLTASLARDMAVAAVGSTSELYQQTAARLAGALGLPAQDPEAVALCRDKGALRRALAEAGLHQPRFRLVVSADAARAAAHEVGLPCVVKPVDDSGSTLVRRCDTAEEAVRHAAEVLAVEHNGRGQPTARRALVESLLTGPEYSVETFGTDAGHVVLGVVEKSVTGAPAFVEHRHLLSGRPDAESASELESVVLAALKVIGLRGGAAHTEVKLTEAGPAVVEVNPRLAGGMIPELFLLVTGVDLVAAQVAHDAGGVPRLPDAFSGAAGIQFLMADRTGVLAAVHGTEDARALPGVERVVLTRELGQPVAPPVDAYGRLGYVIARGDSAAEVAEVLAQACGLLRIDVTAATDTGAGLPGPRVPTPGPYGRMRVSGSPSATTTWRSPR
ncbi:ATP-grasp domain-containing protein [Streptomyces malaysiensis subsp. malaysiensis]|uniref:pyridoxal-phosphate dependent enzyme n=1 Tax=Streptomyces malaysiensis TaxID=92644 RepID=UPI000BFBA2D4|nr:pyridoxal-phosphate dependent enzyme [Streptomyces malaysiensis]QDL69640.1 ATP-grasp domain-containing protein [Streptomyces malaysiensis]